MMSILSRKIGIDLGTSTVLIYVKGEGIVVNEPSLIAVNRDGTRILAVGNQAFAMVGRAPESIQVVRPMRDGAIADFVVTEGMLQHLIGKVQGRQRLFKPEIMICVPSGVTSVERRAVTEAAISAGARQAWLIDAPLAAAIGAGLPIAEPRGNAIGDIVEAIQEPLRLIVGAVRDALGETPPELAADIFDRGMVLSGGGAQLRGIDRYISMHTGIPAVVADEPQTTVVRGTGLALENFGVMKRNQSYFR